MANFSILAFIGTGNYRLMLIYCNWDKWQFIVYKVIRFGSALFFLVYGSYITVNKSLVEPDLFLLFIFTSFSYNS